MSNEELIKEWQPHFGKLVLDGLSGVVRLIGIFEDPEEYNEPYFEIVDRKGKKALISVLLWITPLYGYIPMDDYNYWERIWQLNVKYEDEPKADHSQDS